MHIIGTNHFDIAGPQRLRKVLDEIQPRIITVELPAELDTFEHAKRSERLGAITADLIPIIYGTSESPLVKLTSHFLRECFQYEVRVCVDYAQRTGAEVYGMDTKESLESITSPVDPVIFAQTIIELFDGMGSGTIFRRALSLSSTLEAANENMFNLWREHLDHAMRNNRSRLSEDYQGFIHRERYQARKVREHNSDMNVGGSSHLKIEPSIPRDVALPQLLADFSPTITHLYDVSASY